VSIASIAHAPLGDFMLFRGGSTDPSRHPDDPFVLYSIPAFDAGRPEFVQGSEIGSPKKNVESGDILSRIVPHIRRGWIVGEHSEGKILASGEWIVFRSEKVDASYLRHFLVSDVFHPHFMQTVAGVGGSLLRANPNYVAEITIPLPPLDEQGRIATILDKADVLRRKRKRALDLLDSLTQSIFLEMFGDPIENTKRLPVAKLEEVVSATRKITYGILKPGDDQPGGIPYIRVVDIQNSRVNWRGLKRTTQKIAQEYKRSSLRAGDLLISIRGHVGRMAITPRECEGANITQDTARLAIEGARSEFVKAQLETDSARHWMAQRTRGAAVQGINLGDLRQFPLILPPDMLQTRFAAIIGIIRQQIETSSTELLALDSLFSSLQHRAFSGQL
jgi:type I restriction enzyme S subunit